MSKNKEKKIVIASEIWFPDAGGPATYAKKIAEELTRRHYKVEVVTYADKFKSNYELVTAGRSYRVTRVSRKVPVLIRYFIYLGDLLRISWNADVIYAQGALSAGWPAMWAKRLTGKKVVVKVVGDQAWERAYQGGKTDKLLDDFLGAKLHGKIRHIQKIQMKVLNAADDIISVSNYFKTIFKTWGISPEKIHVIHNSVEESKTIDQPNIKIEGDVILSVGRLTVWKGMDTLIKIMPDLLQENPNFKLIIIGGGPQEKYLLNLIDKMNLKDSVILTGKLKHEEIAAYYKQAKMLILNSGYDNWSHVLLEAMTNGLPVIASNIGGNPELVKDGETGLIADYNDKIQLKTAISRLWLNEDLAYQLSTNARKEVAKYTFNDLADKTIEVLLSSKHS